MRGPRRRAHVALAIALLIVGILPGPVAAALPAPQPSVVILDGSQGDRITQGQFYRSDTPYIFAWIDEDGREVEISVDDYDIRLRAALGEVLGPGTYVLPPSPSGFVPEISVNGRGGCNAQSGRFVILEGPEWNTAGDVTNLAVDFEQRCEPTHHSILAGAVRIGSELPVQLLGMTPQLEFGTIDSGHTVVGNRSAPQTVTVINHGTVATQVTSISLVGDHPTDFEVGDDTCSGTTLDPNETCTVAVTFTPTDTIARDARLQAAFDGPLATRNVRLRGWADSPLTLLPSSFRFESSPGDPVNLGKKTQYDDPLVQVNVSEPDNIELLFELWSFRIGSQAPLVAGEYLDARGGPGADALHPHLRVDGRRGDCPSGSTGSFRLLETPVFDKDGTLLSLVANFTQTCVGYTAPLRGWIRYHSTVPLADDPNPPTVTTPEISILGGVNIDKNGQPKVRVAWSGSDDDSGVAHYQVESSTDGSAFAPFITNLTTPAFERYLFPGRSYRFRVRAVDHAENVGAWAATSTVRLATYQETSSRVTRTGSWSTKTSTGVFGGTVAYTSKVGATMSFTFTGASVAWVSAVGPKQGSARVFIDGVEVAMVDTFSSTKASRRIVWVGSWATSEQRTVTIESLGTVGHPRIDVDGFVTFEEPPSG